MKTAVENMIDSFEKDEETFYSLVDNVNIIQSILQNKIFDYGVFEPLNIVSVNSTKEYNKELECISDKVYIYFGGFKVEMEQIKSGSADAYSIDETVSVEYEYRGTKYLARVMLYYRLSEDDKEILRSIGKMIMQEQSYETIIC